MAAKWAAKCQQTVWLSQFPMSKNYRNKKGSGHGWALKQLLYVTIIITSKNRRPPKFSRVCSSMNPNSTTGLWGKSAHQRLHIRPHGNFMLSGVLWCLSSSCLSSIIKTSSTNDESSIFKPLSFPLIAMSELWFSRISSTVTYRGV